MDKKTTLATIAFCLSTAQAYGSTQEVDLQTLQLLQEERVSVEEFNQAYRPSAGGNYSRFSISDGNYSRFSISNSNYSRFSISDGNYSRFSISDSNYSRFSISGAMPPMNAEGAIPQPVSHVGEDPES